MSKESVMSFMHDSHKKPELKKILDKPKSDFDSKEAKMEYIVKEAQKHGYKFDVSDLKSVIEMPESDLSDDALLNVAGGGMLKDTWKKAKGSLKDGWNSGVKGVLQSFKKWIG